MKGRKRIAQEIHRINGSYEINPNRENKQAPLANGREPIMPDYFDEHATLKWLELVEDLRMNGILSTDLREILIAYCMAYSGWIQARKIMKATGMALPFTNEAGEKDWKRNPWTVEVHKYRDTMNKLLPELGLTPASRQRMIANKPPEDDPFAQWLEGVGSG